MSALLLLIAPALASGNPGRTPETGLIDVHLGVGQDLRVLSETSETCSDACDAWSRDFGTELQVGLRPSEVFGLWARGGYHQDSVDAADFAATGYGLSGGFHLTAPGSGHPLTANLRPALSTTARYIYTYGDDGDHRRFLLEAAATLVAGTDEGNVVAWIGPSATLVSLRELNTEETNGLVLVPSYPVGGVLGAELLSDQLGPPWISRSARLLLGTEIRMVDDWGFRLWLGFSY